MVTKSEVDSVVEILAQSPVLSVDCETTGLNLWLRDKIFSIIISNGENTYYFNLQIYPELDSASVLLVDDIRGLQRIFSQPSKRIFFANAKFDLAALQQIGFEIKCKVYDVLVMDRLIFNEHMDYSLAACVKRIGLEKSEAVEDYIKEKDLWMWESVPGKKHRVKNKFFDRVPFEIIEPYGIKDAELTFALGSHNLKKLEALSAGIENKKAYILNVLENEVLLTKTCFEMEKVGIKIDRGYCAEALCFEKARYKQAAEDFETISKYPFIDSNKQLSTVFNGLGISSNKTSKGNPSFTDKALATIDSPLAQLVRDYREAYKKASTYYQSFMYFADKSNTLHANIKQAGTTTGRFSYSNPNLQNIPKEKEETKYPVRRAFIPREDFIFVEFDYKAFEYRLMVEYAGEESLANAINEGVDVHEATAKMMGVDRKTAKTLNFMLLYGGGAQKLADALGIKLEIAKKLKQDYFSALPNVKAFIYDVTKMAERRGFIFNWLGRRHYFPNPEFCYKAPNALIQGGTADIVKVAMNTIAKYLVEKKSRMLIQIHDSILFEIHKTEFTILQDLKQILENSYKSRYVKMETSISHSAISWQDMVDGIPQ